MRETAVRESNQGFERAEEQDEGQLELEESLEIRERACDESVGSHTEGEIPEGEEDEEEGEEHEDNREEEISLQRQREEQPAGQQVDPCGSSTAPSSL